MINVNNKGFTLIELLATIVILVLVIGLGSYAITNIIKNSKEENYKLLVKNVKDAAELYYQECKFANSNNTGITCTSDWTVTLGNLVSYGYLKGNDTDSNKKFTIVNPKDNVNISSCKIKINYSGGKVNVSAVNPSGSCPTSY